MQRKFILFSLVIIVFLNYCEKPGESKRKIRLSSQQTLGVFTDRQKDVSVIHLDANETHKVVILPFCNETGESEMEWLSKGLADMLIRDFSQSSFVKVTDLQRISDIFKNLHIESPDALDFHMLSEIGELTQSEAVLTGSFQNRNDSLIIDVDVYNVDAGLYVDKKIVSGNGLEDIFNMIDDLSSRIKSALKLSFDRFEESDLKIADISTRSLVAYQAYTEGVELAYKAYWSDALAKFEKAIELDSTFAMAHFWGSVMLSRLDRNDAANHYIESAKHLSGNVTPKEKMKIDWIYSINKGKRHEGLEILKSIIEQYPDDKEYRYHLANSYLFYKELEKAEAELQQALKLDPNYMQACILRSEVLQEQGEYNCALNCLKKYIMRNPDAAAAYHELARIYENLGEYDKAVYYYNKAVSIKSDFYISYLSLANLYSTIGEYDHATDNYLSALSIVPTEELKARVFTGLANISKAQGKYNQAIEQIRFAAEYQRNAVNRVDYLMMLSGIYFNKGEIDSSKALSIRVLAIQPMNILALEMLGRVHVGDGDIDSAKSIAGKIDKIISDLRFEKFRNIHFRLLGKIAEAEEKYEKSRRYFEKILENNSEAISMYEALGGIYLKKNEPEKAIHSYKRYMEKNPYAAPVLYQMALAYEALGDTSRVEHFMNQFLDLWNDADSDIFEVKDALRYVHNLENE